MDMMQPDERLRDALNALAAQDADIAKAFAACGLPPLRRQPPRFAGLVNIIASQQLAAAAARTIRERIEAAIQPLTAERFLAVPEEEIRALGLSRPKLRYLRGIAEAEQSGELDFDAMALLSDQEVMEQLTRLKGVGRWTAEIFLLFALERPDVLPAQDLALQVAVGRLKGLDERPSAAALQELAEPWRPYRSAASRFLWHYNSHPGAP